MRLFNTTEKGHVVQTEPKSTILLVVSRSLMSQVEVYKLGQVLYDRGFYGIVLRAESETPIQLFNLDNLPDGDIQEIKNLIEQRDQA